MKDETKVREAAGGKNAIMVIPTDFKIKWRIVNIYD